jgi:hypothetical protein
MPKRNNVLVVGDYHAPANLKNYAKFCHDIYERWNCNRTVMIGDLVDNAALSFHLKDPTHKDPIAEYNKAMREVKKLVDLFPDKVDYLLGNHCVNPYRWCKEVGIPEEWMRSPKDIWNLPKTWKVWPRYHQLVIDNVIYQHGDRGRNSAILNAKAEFKSCVQGHYHSKSGVEFYCNKEKRIFGCQVGCGIDYTNSQMNYSIPFTAKPVVSCAVVLEGRTAIVEPMIL